jgi:hypothetical protein
LQFKIYSGKRIKKLRSKNYRKEKLTIIKTYGGTGTQNIAI